MIITTITLEMAGFAGSGGGMGGGRFFRFRVAEVDPLSGKVAYAEKSSLQQGIQLEIQTHVNHLRI